MALSAAGARVRTPIYHVDAFTTCRFAGHPPRGGERVELEGGAVFYMEYREGTAYIRRE